MCEEKKPKEKDSFFDYILARSRARESSTLTIATVAASASLVLIVLFIQGKLDAIMVSQEQEFASYKIGIIITGLLFALVGLVYRIVTACTIHKKDEELLKGYFTEEQRAASKSSVSSGIREALLYILLGIPVVVWIIILCYFK